MTSPIYTSTADSPFFAYRLENTDEKITSFQDRKKGWHFGSGNPPSNEVIESALRILDQVHAVGFFNTDAFCSSEGDISVTIYVKGNYLEFVCNRDNTLTFCHEKEGAELEFSESLQIDNISQKLIEIKNQACDSSDLLRLNTLKDSSADSTVKLSERRVEMAEYRSLISNVALMSPSVCATT